MKDNIGYSGRVTIKVKGKPPVKKKNSGTPVLFNTLCDILTSTNVSDTKAFPAYISLIHNMRGAITPEIIIKNSNYLDYVKAELVTSLSPISSRQSRPNGSCVFSSMITHSQANISNSVNVETCYVVLLSGEKKIMAFFELDFSSVFPVFSDINRQAVIEWEMFFDNKEIKE